MSLQLFGHPFSSKAPIALYADGTPSEFRIIDQDNPDNGAELARRWPFAKFPVLVDDGRTVAESSTIPFRSA